MTTPRFHDMLRDLALSCYLMLEWVSVEVSLHVFGEEVTLRHSQLFSLFIVILHVRGVGVGVR